MSNRVSRGQAEAVLNAGPSGGSAILNRSGGVLRGAPADNEVRAAIRPYENTIWDGRHFCAEDWHLLVAAWFLAVDESYTAQQVKDELAATTIQLVLDGVELNTQRTAIKRFVEVPEYLGGAEEAYYFQQGAIMAPADLSVGSHAFAFTATFPGGSDGSQSTFVIDAPGTGACL
jgi:hypothetical protein